MATRISTLLIIFPVGTEILTVQAADNDDPKTDNVRIFYRLAGQMPESPRQLFRVDRDSGVITVQADSMEGTAPQYTLTIIAEDAKGWTHTHHEQEHFTWHMYVTLQYCEILLGC